MSENPYAAPEAVVEIADISLSRYLRRLRMTRTGLIAFQWAAVMEVVLGAQYVMLMWTQMEFQEVLMLLPAVYVLQLAGTVCCWRCPADVVRGGRWWLVLGWVTCVAGWWMFFFGDVFFRISIFSSANEIHDWGLALIVCSRVPWLWFLMSLGAGVRNRRAGWLGFAAVWLWLTAGLGTIAFLYVESMKGYLPAGKEWLGTLHSVAHTASPLAWIAFIGLYLALLADLRGWLGELVEMKSEEGSDE